MNITSLCVSFSVIFSLFLLALFALAAIRLYLFFLQAELEETKRDVSSPAPLEVTSENVAIRVRGAEVEVFEEEAEKDFFSPVKESFSSRYERLLFSKRMLLDEFSSRFSSIENCSYELLSGGLSFRYRRKQIVRAVIKKGDVVLVFSFYHPRLKELFKGIPVRMRPAEIRLKERTDLEAAIEASLLQIEALREEEPSENQEKIEAQENALQEAAIASSEEIEQINA